MVSTDTHRLPRSDSRVDSVDSQDETVWLRLKDVPGVTTTYGVVQPGYLVDKGVPMLRAQDIGSGALLRNTPVNIHPEVHLCHPRTHLRVGDLVIVLVGRVGDAALITEDQEGWNAARSVGVVRCEPSLPGEGVVEWIRYWMMSPSARQWFSREARGFAQPTLSIRALGDMRIPFPPMAERRRCVEALALVEERSRASLDVATSAVSLADAHFARSSAIAGSRRMSLGDVSQAIAGGSRTGDFVAGTTGSDSRRVSTAEVLGAQFPYLRKRDLSRWGGGGGTQGQLLLATKKGSARVVLDGWGESAAERGTLVVRPMEARDQWWLLHELRSRGPALAAVAQGTSGRELSIRAFGRLPVDWPAPAVREHFARVAEALHERAQLALEDDDDMKALLGRLVESAVHRSDSSSAAPLSRAQPGGYSPRSGAGS